MNAAPPSGRPPPFLRIIARQDGALVLYDSLSGAAATLPATAIDDLASERDPGKALQNILDETGLSCTDPAHDRAVFEAHCHANRADTPERNSFRIGFLLDRLDEAQLNVAIAAAREEMNRRRNAPLFLHFWTWSAAAFAALHGTMQALTAAGPSPGARAADISLTLDASFPADDRAEETLEAFSALCGGTCQAVFMLHETALEKAGSAQAYAHEVFRWQSLFFRFGFTPAFILLIGPASRKTMGEDFFEELCFSGVYPRNIHMSFIKSTPDEAAISCEMHGLDGHLYADAATTLLSRATHRIVEPLALGYGDALRGALSRDARWPRFYHCPYTRPTLFFAGDHAGACPVALTRAATGDRGIAPLLSPAQNPDAALMSRWRQRGPHSIDACRGCGAAALCASGCPLAAFEKHGSIDAPDCPPVEAIDKALGALLTQEAGTAG